jgi:hypothetical protein
MVKFFQSPKNVQVESELGSGRIRNFIGLPDTDLNRQIRLLLS